jgi:hypothetical protein
VGIFYRNKKQDKLGWTGSKIQLVNGIVLLITFFGARIVFGTVMSYKMWSKFYLYLRVERWTKSAYRCFFLFYFF